MKLAVIKAHLRTARNYAELSHCGRKKVGCIIVKDDRIISIGYNGTLPGWDNACECADNITLPHVIHAESNAITKLAKSSDSGEHASVFITLSPCLNCAMLLAQINVKEVFYIDDYRTASAGIDLLNKCNIPVTQIDV